MKKSFLLLATAALFAACASDSVRENIAEDQVEIGFSTYIQKPVASKADNSNATALKGLEAYHDNFVVNGFKTVANAETQVFTDQSVTYNSADDKKVWEYSPVSYWDKSASAYTFYAAAPAGAGWNFANNKYTLEYTVSGSSLETEERATPNAAANLGNDDMMIATDKTATNTNGNFGGTVEFTFNHILSRFNIAISTSITDGVVTLKALEVSGLKKSGKFDETVPDDVTLNAGTTARWTELSEPYTLAANDELLVKNFTTDVDNTNDTYKQFVYQGLVIPQVAAAATIALNGTDAATSAKPYLNIQYSIKTGEGATAKSQDYSYFYNLADLFNGDSNSDLAFNEGWQNNLYITIGAAAINFDADVYEWANANDGTLTVD